MRRPILQRLASLLVATLAAFDAQAHDPFDASARLVVQPDHLELIITTGVDAAMQTLAQAGLPPLEVNRAVKERPERSAFDLPATVAARFFELKAGSAPLTAKSLRVFSPGVEIVFTAIYPRPAPGTLAIRAVYFEHNKEILRGACVAVDTAMKPLGWAILSQEKPAMQVPMPGIAEQTMPVAGNPLPEENPASAPAAAPPVTPTAPSFGEYFRLGVEHILIGFDHLLFLAALLIGVRGMRPMLVIITCFTLAHSVTLALAALDLVTISPRLVEPVIAASIIVVGVENLWRRDATTDRYWMAGGFGLIHGFGFAGVLRETGLGQSGSSIAMPLLSFNLGVEAGQLAVAAIVVPLLILLRRRPAFARYAAPALSAVVIAISGYWLLERTVLAR